MATTQVLREAMPGDDYPGAAVLLRPHIGRCPAFSLPWSHSTRLLHTARLVPGGWKQLLEDRRVYRRLIGGYLTGCELGGANHPLQY